MHYSCSSFLNISEAKNLKTQHLHCAVKLFFYLQYHRQNYRNIEHRTEAIAISGTGVCLQDAKGIGKA